MRMKWVSLLLLPVLAGCVSPLDRAQSKVRLQFHDVAGIFAAATGTFVKGANEQVVKKHDLQGQIILDRWNASLHVNTDEGGKVEASWLVQALPLRDKALAAKRASERSWRLFSGAYGDALAKFKATNLLLADQESSIMARKETVQETLTLTFQALGAIAIGAGF